MKQKMDYWMPKKMRLRWRIILIFTVVLNHTRIYSVKIMPHFSYAETVKKFRNTEEDEENYTTGTWNCGEQIKESKAKEDEL